MKEMLLVNFEEIVKRLYQWSVGGKSHPLMARLYLQPQSDTDYGLPLLRAGGENGEVEHFLDEKDILSKVDELIETGVREYRFVAGVKNFYPADLLMTVLSKIKEKGMKAGISSHGMPLSRYNLRRMIDIGVDTFEFTVFGHDEATHYLDRKKDGSWNNISSAMGLLNRLDSTPLNSLPGICMNAMLTKHNWNRLPNMIRLAHRSGADTFQLQLYYARDGAPDMTLLPRQVRDLLLLKDDLINICELYELRHNLKKCLTERMLFDIHRTKEKYALIKKNRLRVLRNTIPRFKKRFPEMGESFIRFVTLRNFQPWYVFQFGPEGVFIPTVKPNSGDRKDVSDRSEGDEYMTERDPDISGSEKETEALVRHDHGKRGSVGGGDESYILPVLYYKCVPSADMRTEDIWFSDDYEDLRRRRLKRDPVIIEDASVLFGLGEIKEIQKGLLKRWQKEQKTQPPKGSTKKDLLSEYRQKEINAQVKMLNKDIQWLQIKLKDINKRMELYKEDKEKMLKLEGSRGFKLYRALSRVL